MLEAAAQKDNVFCTLTYNDASMPADLSVHPRVIQLFMKRLRKSFHRPLRFFACGEYGDTTMRPHYHLALFGYPPCNSAITRLSKSGKECCPQCTLIKTAWGSGEIMLGTLEPKSMAYIAGYVTKKMTRHDDPRLEGRLPEFARMSLRPGIGYSLMHDLASTLMELQLDTKLIDVPTCLAHGKLKLPLGRYLRRSLRKLIGKEPNAPQEVINALKEKMRPLREAAFNASTPFKTAVLEASLGKRIQIEAKAKRKKVNL